MVLPPMLSPRIHLNLIFIWYRWGTSIILFLMICMCSRCPDFLADWCVFGYLTVYRPHYTTKASYVTPTMSYPQNLAVW